MQTFRYVKLLITSQQQLETVIHPKLIMTGVCGREKTCRLVSSLFV